MLEPCTNSTMAADRIAAMKELAKQKMAVAEDKGKIMKATVNRSANKVGKRRGLPSANCGVGAARFAATHLPAPL